MPDASPSRPRYLARLNANGVRYAYTRPTGREWLPKHLLPTPTAGTTPLHDGAVQALSGISKVEDDAETAMMHRVTLQALRMLP